MTIQAGAASKSPLFCIHAEAGDVSLYYAVARHIPDDQPLLGLCAPPSADAHLEQIAALHVQTIRATQSEGPYLILGECTGGALAYEIAKQLRDAGGDVRLLALIDSFPPNLPRLRPWMPRALYRIVHRSRILAFHAENLVRLPVAEKFAYVAQKARRVRRKSVDTWPSTFTSALAAYTPTPYDAPMVLFRAARLPLGIEPAPADLGWAVFASKLTTETIPGYFTTPISEPRVRILADKLAAHLASDTR